MTLVSYVSIAMLVAPLTVAALVLAAVARVLLVVCATASVATLQATSRRATRWVREWSQVVARVVAAPRPPTPDARLSRC